jgi:D-alanine-D-alanine ligase
MTETVVAVLFGGRSCEHEVSVLTAHEVMAVLQEMPSYSVLPIYITRDGRWLTGRELMHLNKFAEAERLERSCQPLTLKPMGRDVIVAEYGSFVGRRKALHVDVALPLLHGPNGEDGTLQGTLEMLGLPYAGSGVLASALCMNKVAMKQMFAFAGLPQVAFSVVRRAQWRDDRVAELARVQKWTSDPVFVKPVRGGSSVGVTFVEEPSELAASIDLALEFDEEAIVEVAVLGADEINCSVLRTPDTIRTSVLESVRSKESFLSYEQKYMQWSKGAPAKGVEGHEIPASLPEELAARVRSLAQAVFEVSMCDGVARIDFLVKDADVYVIEVNTIPGSLAFYLWEASGMRFDRLLDSLLASARAKWESRQSTVFRLDRNLLADIEERKGAKRR